MRDGFFGSSHHKRRGRGAGFMQRFRHRHRGGPGGGHGPIDVLKNIFELNFAALGTTCRVVGIGGHPAVRQRLVDLGLCPGREIVILRNAPLNDPIEIKIGDSYIAVRRHEAAAVEVEYV
jgi:ferrous iron transport protein A